MSDPLASSRSLKFHIPAPWHPRWLLRIRSSMSRFRLEASCVRQVEESLLVLRRLGITRRWGQIRPRPAGTGWRTLESCASSRPVGLPFLSPPFSPAAPFPVGVVEWRPKTVGRYGFRSPTRQPSRSSLASGSAVVKILSIQVSG